MDETVTLNLSLSPVDLTLLQDCVRGRIEELDRTYDRVRADEDALPFRLVNDDLETNRLMRGVYQRIAHQIGQLLETPFIDTHEAVNLLWSPV